MEIGFYNTLVLNRFTSVGAFLENEEGESVLLPKKWVPEGIEEGDELEVFVYLDHEERPVATTMRPLIVRDSFAWLKCKDLSKIGAFMDWGLEKDLFVPFIEQAQRMQPGSYYVVYMYLDEMTGRLTASSKLEYYVEKDEIDLRNDQEVDILIAGKSDLGFNVIIEDKYLGLIYDNEIFKPIKTGDRMRAFVKKVRDDKKIDISLEKQGYASIEPNALKIMERLKEAGGKLPLNDKSEPEEIYKRLQMSKKVFKKAIGGLYKEKLISIDNEGIRLA